MSKKKQHHSKPHGGGVSFAQRLAQQRMLQQALTDEVAMQQADLWAKQDTQRGLVDDSANYLPFGRKE